MSRGRHQCIAGLVPLKKTGNPLNSPTVVSLSEEEGVMHEIVQCSGFPAAKVTAVGERD